MTSKKLPVKSSVILLVAWALLAMAPSRLCKISLVSYENIFRIQFNFSPQKLPFEFDDSRFKLRYISLDKEKRLILEYHPQEELILVKGQLSVREVSPFVDDDQIYYGNPEIPMVIFSKRVTIANVKYGSGDDQENAKLVWDVLSKSDDFVLEGAPAIEGFLSEHFDSEQALAALMSKTFKSLARIYTSAIGDSFLRTYANIFHNDDFTGSIDVDDYALQPRLDSADKKEASVNTVVRMVGQMVDIITYKVLKVEFDEMLYLEYFDDENDFSKENLTKLKTLSTLSKDSHDMTLESVDNVIKYKMHVELMKLKKYLLDEANADSLFRDREHVVSNYERKILSHVNQNLMLGLTLTRYFTDLRLFYYQRVSVEKRLKLELSLIASEIADGSVSSKELALELNSDLIDASLKMFKEVFSGPLDDLAPFFSKINAIYKSLEDLLRNVQFKVKGFEINGMDKILPKLESNWKRRLNMSPTMMEVFYQSENLSEEYLEELGEYLDKNPNLFPFLEPGEKNKQKFKDTIQLILYYLGIETKDSVLELKSGVTNILGSFKCFFEPVTLEYSSTILI